MKLPILVLLLHSVPAYCQHIQTYSLINQNGIYAAFSNPAFTANSTDWLSFNFAGVGAGMENNRVQARFAYSIPEFLYMQPSRDLEMRSTEPYYTLSERQLGKPGFHFSSQMILPSFKINPNPNLSLFFYMRERINGNLNLYEGDLLSIIVEKKMPSDLSFNGKMEARFFAWNETAVGISHVLYNRRETMIKGGIAIKKISGRLAYIFDLQDLNAQAIPEGLLLSAQYRLMETTLNKIADNTFDFITGRNGPGKGISADIGFVYEYRPYYLRNRYVINNRNGRNHNFTMRSQSKYLYRIGISLNDIGSISYSGSTFSDRNMELNTMLSAQAVAEQSFVMEEVLMQARIVSERNDILVKLPATLQLSFDTRIKQHWYLAVNYSQNLRNTKVQENIFIPSALTLLLRKEMQYVTFGMPLRIVPHTKTFVFGWITKAGPFFAGIDNVNVLFLNRIYNISAFFGVCMNLNYRRDPTIENFKAFK